MSRAVWVTRDEDGWYKFHAELPELRPTGSWISGKSVLICEGIFNSLIRFRLKPGEGPVKVRIEVKRVK